MSRPKAGDHSASAKSLQDETAKTMADFDQHDHRKLTDALLPAVLAAGRLEMGFFNSGCAVETKADLSPVTIADRQAEAIVVAAVEQHLPGLSIVAEEAFAAGHRPTLTETFVLIDALDGTKQFVSGHREFTINIAIVRHGHPVYGLIYAPALGDLLVTDGPEAARHAHLAPSAAIASLADATPTAIRVSDRTFNLVAVQSRSRNADATTTFLADYSVADVRRLGSSYKFCLIAQGVADIYAQLGDTNEWDTAAGHAIVIAAGGSVTALDGTPLAYGKSAANYKNPLFVATNKPLATLRKPVI